MYSSWPTKQYHFQADLNWCDSTFKFHIPVILLLTYRDILMIWLSNSKSILKKFHVFNFSAKNKKKVQNNFIFAWSFVGSFLIYIISKNSVVDPWQFGTNLDPRIRDILVRLRICGSVPLTYGSGSCSQWPSRRQINF